MFTGAITLSHPSLKTTSTHPKHEPAWQKVTVLKKDEKGRIIRSEETGKPEKVSFDKETKSGDLYWHESQLSIALKSAALFLFTPVFTAGVITWNFCRVPVDICRIAHKALHSHPSPRKVFQAFTWTIPKRVSLDLWNIVRAPFYALGVEFTSACGVVSPYRGRKWEAIVEHAWQRKVSFRDDFRYCDPKTGRWVYDFLYGVKHAKAFYLAWCFQKRHHIDDDDIRVIKHG